MAARKKAARKKVETPAVWTPDYDDIIDEISQSVGLTPISMDRANHVEHCISTGLLAYDLAVGGGFGPGRFCGMYGPEAGGKSTLCAASIAETQKKKIPAFVFDHEGSADAAYWGRIGIDLYDDFRSEDAQAEAGTEQGFKAGPYLRYYAPQTAEMALKFMGRLLTLMPDKRLYEDNWYYVMNKSQKEAKAKGIPFNLALTRKLGNKKQVWVPAEDGRAQAIFYIDSIASMQPEALVGQNAKKKGEWKDNSGAQALLARVFSKELPAVTAAMVAKRVTIVATNQFREKPGVTFGNPVYAPGGHAQEHAHDNRGMIRRMTSPAGWGSGMIAEETCWDGKGKDRYTYAKLKSEKSKDFMPHKICWVRWWFESKGAPGPGIDPVFDTFQYLKMTGQLDKPSGSTTFQVSLPGHEASYDSAGFKRAILDPENNGELREACWKQLREGDGFTRFFETEQTGEA